MLSFFGLFWWLHKRWWFWWDHWIHLIEKILMVWCSIYCLLIAWSINGANVKPDDENYVCGVSGLCSCVDGGLNGELWNVKSSALLTLVDDCCDDVELCWGTIFELLNTIPLLFATPAFVGAVPMNIHSHFCMEFESYLRDQNFDWISISFWSRFDITLIANR